MYFLLFMIYCFLDIFQLESGFQDLAVNAVPQKDCLLIFMIQFRQKIFHQIPQLRLHLPFFPGKTAEEHFFFLYIQVDILRPDEKLFRVHKIFGHLFHGAGKTSEKHPQILCGKHFFLIVRKKRLSGCDLIIKHLFPVKILQPAVQNRRNHVSRQHTDLIRGGIGLFWGFQDQIIMTDVSFIFRAHVFLLFPV